MTVKLRAIDRWQKLGAGSIPLPGKKRIVTLDVNVDERTRFAVLQNKRATLLRTVEPWECPLPLSFVVEGDCAVVAETEGEVWWMSDDGDILAYPVVTESFTKLEQRMEMTPEMEVTILRANLSAERRKREVAELLAIKRQREEEAVAAGADLVTGEVNEVLVDADEGATDAATVAGDSASPKP